MSARIDERDDVLARAIDAVRASGDGDDGVDMYGALTVRRVRRTLDQRARRTGWIAAIATAIGIASGGGAAWAIATGRWVPLRATTTATASATEPEPGPVAALGASPADVDQPDPTRVMVSEEAMPVVAAPELPPVEAPAVPRAVPPVPPVPIVPVDVDVDDVDARAYQRAHALHFHGGAPADALAAWDAYLHDVPGGRFASEARYNRGLALIRLGRLDEARAALAPFARGEIDPAGYRQAEARAIVDRLDARDRSSTLQPAAGTHP